MSVPAIRACCIPIRRTVRRSRSRCPRFLCESSEDIIPTIRLDAYHSQGRTHAIDVVVKVASTETVTTRTIEKLERGLENEKEKDEEKKKKN